MSINLGGLPLGIGSLPHTDIDAACRSVLAAFPKSPFWPELPARDWRESMGVDQVRGLPGAVIDDEGRRAFFELSGDLSGELGRFYEAYLSENISEFAVSPEFLPGQSALARMLAMSGERPIILKGQLTGPTTLGLMMKDTDGRALLYNEQMMDVIVKSTRLKAKWLISEMAPFCKTPAVFFDEPMLQSIGSASIPIDTKTAVARLREIVDGLDCLTGGHCCGNTDWSIMMAAGLDVIAYDAWSFGDTLGLYGEDLAGFIERGGYVAWGIVPASSEGAVVDTSQLISKMEDLISRTAAGAGINEELLRERGFITPSCGLGSLSVAEAEEILRKTAAVSAALWG